VPNTASQRLHPFSILSYSIRYDEPHSQRNTSPTRRSSDLGAWHLEQPDWSGRILLPIGIERMEFFGPTPAEELHPLDPDRQQDRSEEHTSELQSRENLVCRLLLEKKNKHNRITSTLLVHNA